MGSNGRPRRVFTAEYKSEVVELCRSGGRSIGQVCQDLAALTSEIETLAKQHYPDLIAINGLGPLSADQIIGLVGQRAFHSEAHFAAYSGASPIQASSAGKTRHRLSRFGNRKLNAVAHRPALTQCRSYEPAKAYMRRHQHPSQPSV